MGLSKRDERTYAVPVDLQQPTPLKSRSEVLRAR